MTSEGSDVMNSPLQVPSTEKTRHLLLDTDSRKLASEIRDLPYADIPSALLIAHRRLHAFNRFSMPPAKRLELLRPFHYAFLRFSEHYRRHFEQGPFARELHPGELDNLLEFLREMAIGFKHLVHDTLARNKRPNGVALVLYMALNYLHHFALFSCNRGRMLKPSFWKEVHYLYFAARDIDQHQADLQTPDGRQVMIEQVYKQIILLGLCSPHSLASEEHWRCHDYLTRFAGLADIAPADGMSAGEDAYILHAHCSQPAQMPECGTTLPPGARLLDLAPFVDNLQRHIEAVKGGESLRIVGMDRLQRKVVLDLLMRLHRNWTRNPVRKSDRNAVEEQIGLVWGLENICLMLDPVMRRQAALYGRNRETENRAWAHTQNQSSQGFCLRLEHEDDHYPEAGQIVALIRQTGQQKTLEVGLVQWCAIDQSNLPLLGIERLLGKANKVTILPQDDHGTERNGLLIIARTADGRARSMLVCPAGVIKPGTRAQVYTPHQADELYLDAFAVTHRTRQVETFEVRALQ